MKATLFADELNIPIGVLPLPRPPGGKTAAIVWSIPHIWKLTDTDDDGKADLREVLYGPFDFRDTQATRMHFVSAPTAGCMRTTASRTGRG